METRSVQGGDISASTGMKIEILLAEYISLREEAMQRDTTLNQALLVAAAAIIGIVTTMLTYSVRIGFIVAVVAVGLVFFTFNMIEYEVKRVSARLRDLESKINELAGEPLLKWETTNGLLATGHKPQFVYVFHAFLIALTFGLWKPR